MKNIFLIILAIIVLASCNNSNTKNVKKSERLELVPEPDKEGRLKFEAIKKLKNENCNFIEPDTSLSGIILGNSKSAENIIGNDNIIDSIDQYHFYSKQERETLTLTQHPGDVKNQISIFKVEYSDKASYDYKLLETDTFKTESGIKLGLTKKQITQRFGNCYAPIDSTKDYIELYYLIEQPKDSKTKILEKNNTPVYYASYKLKNDKLEKFEFGFEYP